LKKHAPDSSLLFGGGGGGGGGFSLQFVNGGCGPLWMVVVLLVALVGNGNGPSLLSFIVWLVGVLLLPAIVVCQRCCVVAWLCQC